jgi:putative Mg2+ transporter-C (MgtC) family protein
MLDTFDVITRILAAVVAGAIIGWERESHKKPAGLRTQMLVSLGSAAFVVAGLQFHSQATAENPRSATDFLKVIAGIVGGIGFLGAGSIIQSGGSVKGLTTAATIWISAAIGVACGLGYYVLATSCVLLALTILIVLGVLERFLPHSSTTSESEKNPATR